MKSRLLERLLAFDRKVRRTSKDLVAGVDEAGRGPLAGPVVAAAVILLRTDSLAGLNDSKKVTPENRLELYRQIARSGFVGIGIASEKQIDHLNIYQATRLAMRQAVLALTRTPDFVLVDGKIRLDLPLNQMFVVSGDQKSAAVAAASIVAKVCRDNWMARLDQVYPRYHFNQHKGYATPDHLKLLTEHGPSPVHRRSFGPVQDYYQRLLFYDEVEIEA